MRTKPGAAWHTGTERDQCRSTAVLGSGMSKAEAPGDTEPEGAWASARPGQVHQGGELGSLGLSKSTMGHSLPISSKFVTEKGSLEPRAVAWCWLGRAGNPVYTESAVFFLCQGCSPRHQALLGESRHRGLRGTGQRS